MTNRENVIKGLEICYCPPSKCEDCPYHDLPDEQSCNDVLCLDALALLKEQGPLEPTIRHGISWWFQCSKCKAQIEYGDKFCKECGQEAKWK